MNHDQDLSASDTQMLRLHATPQAPPIIPFTDGCLPLGYRPYDAESVCLCARVNISSTIFEGFSITAPRAGNEKKDRTGFRSPREKLDCIVSDRHSESLRMQPQHADHRFNTADCTFLAFVFVLERCRLSLFSTLSCIMRVHHSGKGAQCSAVAAYHDKTWREIRFSQFTQIGINSAN